MAIDSSFDSSSHHRLDSFTDRERVLAHVEQVLRTAQAGEAHLLSIKGHSGTGKTFLIEYLTKRVCPQAGWKTGNFDFTMQPLFDFRSVLYGVEDTLQGCVPHQSLKQYRIQREKYIQSFDEYRAYITVRLQVEVKEASSASNIQQHAHVDAELRRREMQLRAELTRALLELAEECEQSLCLFFDGYERLADSNPELIGWLWEEVLLKLVKKTPKPMLIITCGWEYPQSAALQPFSTRDELDDFDQPRITAYLQTQHIISSNFSSPNDEVLTQVFYDLSQGHPFVLSLAAIYYQTLPESERSAKGLRARQPLLDEEARIQWLDERLLKPDRLQEPFRTLLERGPILRSFDQATLQTLLQMEGEGNSAEAVLDRRAYEQFLRYPFIVLQNAQSSTLLEKPTFHELTRRIRLRALRQWHPETKQRLHCAMTDYCRKLIEVEQQRNNTSQARLSDTNVLEWLAEIPEQEFHTQLEYLYHALQVKEVQAEVFKQWEMLTMRAVRMWRREHAELLLAIVRQLTEEGELYLNKASGGYGRYLLCYGQFLEQETRWEDALEVQREAMHIFEQISDSDRLAMSLSYMGSIYYELRQIDLALQFYQDALSHFEQAGHFPHIITSLNDIGTIYRELEQPDIAFGFFLRALPLCEQAGDPQSTALTFNNLATIFYARGELDIALGFFLRACALYKETGQPDNYAALLHNIGMIYQRQEKLDLSLEFFQRALSLKKRSSSPLDIALTLYDMAGLYVRQKQWPEAIQLFSQAVNLRRQAKHDYDARFADALEGLGFCYVEQGETEKGKQHYIQARQIRMNLLKKRDKSR